MTNMKRRSRNLVVDTCVVQSAGETGDPVSAACRGFLVEIRDYCDHVVVTQELKDEWKRHQSLFTVRWQRQMAARKKAVKTIVPGPLELNLKGCSEKVSKIIEKDRCLLDAAFSADRIIVTCDGKFQAALNTFSAGIKCMSAIRWINPIQERLADLRDV